MNKSNTNEGGWYKSEMRRYLREDILPLLPEEVKNSIRGVKKYSYSYEEKKSVETPDTIWIPSVREVFLADESERVNNYYEQEGAAYTEGFKDYRSRIRDRAGASGASWWWLRSAYYFYDFDYLFMSVYSDGSRNYFYASSEGGVLVGFCL